MDAAAFGQNYGPLGLPSPARVRVDTQGNVKWVNTAGYLFLCDGLGLTLPMDEGAFYLAFSNIPGRMQ